MYERLFIPKVTDHVSACLYFVVKRSPIYHRADGD